jgi:hypothetical protein
MTSAKLFKFFILVLGLALLSPGAVLAASEEGVSPSHPRQQPMDIGLDTPVSDLIPEDRVIEEWRSGYPSEELYHKHREIDRYVFDDRADEIRLEGFGVTHTGPRDGFIEIGITPYSEEYAGHLYEIFGSDMVKVVEGRQAVTLPFVTGEEPDVEVDAGEAEETNVISEDLSVGVRLDGRMISFDAEPFIENDRVLIPLRGVMEGLGADVEWDGETSTVSVFTEDINIELVIGEAAAKVVRTVDGTPVEETLELDVAAKLVDDRTFIPARFVSETLSAHVEWDNDLRMVIIVTEAEKVEDEDVQEEPDELSLKDYFPLTEGSTWKYLGEGNEYASFSREVLFADGDRAQISEDNGGTVSASVLHFEEDQIVRTFFRGEEYAGNNLLGEEPNDDLVLLKAPLEVGTEWETSNGDRQIIETDVVVDTAAGEFEGCIKIEITTEHSVMYEYYKEGIGLVKREFLSEGMTGTSTLEEYSIK